jgi:FRG domain
MSTLARYTSIPHRSWDTHIDEMLSHFLVKALSIGTIPFPPNDRRSRLEYGRHYGVPSPLIDFSLSPYVALYFAFGGIQYRHGTAPKNAAVYALNLRNLGTCWARLSHGKFAENYDNFMHEKTSFFEHGYPAGQLKFMRFPASWNARMLRQLGCFIYDTLDYSGAGVGKEDFEGGLSR